MSEVNHGRRYAHDSVTCHYHLGPLSLRAPSLDWRRAGVGMEMVCNFVHPLNDLTTPLHEQKAGSATIRVYSCAELNCCSYYCGLTVLCYKVGLAIGVYNARRLTMNDCAF